MTRLGRLLAAATARRFPLQRVGTIPWAIAERAYQVYARAYPGQTLEHLADRGGFDLEELGAFLVGLREPRAAQYRDAERALGEVFAAAAQERAALIGALQQVIDEREQLRGALTEYGVHYGFCPVRTMTGLCSCGLETKLRLGQEPEGGGG